MPKSLVILQPKIQLRGLGERFQLPEWGLGRRPYWNRIWCI